MEDKNMLSKDERKKFLKTLDKGELDPVFEDQYNENIKERAIPSAEKDARLTNIYDNIVAGHNPMPESAATQRRSIPPFMWAAAAVVILVTAAGLWMNSKNLLSSGTEQLAEVKPKVFSGRQLVKLPDGSTALLNENSELTFTESFGTANREVTLIGEALFDVKHDAGKPFIVHTGKVNTEVLGTSFNVKAYSTQQQVTVTVVRGLVRVRDEHRIYGEIKPDEQIEVDVALNDFVKRNTKAEEVVAWQKDFFILDNVTFEEAARSIEERFNVKVSFENEKLKSCKVNAWFSHGENLRQIVEAITSTREATVAISENNVIISGGIACEEN
jgi:transmembrane sensor